MRRRKRAIRRPLQPAKPQKRIESRECITFDEVVTLARVLEDVPDEISRGDVEISLISSQNQITVSWPIMIDNPDLERDMKRYETKLRKYKQRLQQYDDWTKNRDEGHIADMLEDLDKQDQKLSVRLARVSKERAKEELFNT